MDIMLIGCLISAVMAEMLSDKLITVRFFCKRYNIRGILYFIPIWLMLVFKWNTNPDVTVPIGEYWIFFHDIVTLGAVSDAHTVIRFAREPLSWGLIWIMAKLGLSYFGMLAIISTVFSISYALYIDRLSRTPSMSILFFALTCGPIVIGALRQAMSVTFLLIAYSVVLGGRNVSKSQWLKIVLILFVGGLFHSSCFLVLPMFLLANIPFSRKTSLFFLIVVVLFSPFLNNFFNVMLESTRWGDELESERSNFYLSLFLLISFIFFLFFLFQPQVERLNGGKWAFTLITGFFAILILSIFLKFLVDPGRLFHSFIPLVIIIVPNLIDHLRILANKRLVLLTCFFVFGCYFGRTILARTEVNFFYHSVFFVNREDVFELR